MITLPNIFVSHCFRNRTIVMAFQSINKGMIIKYFYFLIFMYDKRGIRKVIVRPSQAMLTWHATLL